MIARDEYDVPAVKKESAFEHPIAVLSLGFLP